MHISTGTCGGRITCNLSRNYNDEDENEDPLFLFEEITAFLVSLRPRDRPQKQKSEKHVIESSKLPLRASLFSHVSPYVEFQLDDAKGIAFPSEFSDYLQWEVTPTTPKIIRQIVTNTGYKLARCSTNWCGSWSDARFAFRFKSLKLFQKINHFPGSYEIGHKDRLCRNMNRLTSAHGRKYFDFVPQTYVLPHDFEKMRAAWNKGRRNKWIVKPPASSRGQGIKLFSKFTRLPSIRSYTIVQQYLSKPKLIDGSKFDLRFYVLVTSFDPLRIYVYSEGLVRFACDQYRNSASTLDNQFMHLTNYSVNKSCSRYENNDTVDACKGHKWSLACLWNYLGNQGVDTSIVLKKIHDMIVKTIISAESTVNSFSRVYLFSRYSCFELLGFDVLLDETMKPWLLEVNISPSLQTSSFLDAAIKGPLIRDVLNIVGYRIPANISGVSLRRLAAKYDELGTSNLSHDMCLYDKILGKREKTKQMAYFRKYDRVTIDNIDSILESLTPDDVRHLMLYEDELTCIGNFSKIFPTCETRRYFRYFKEITYYNLLFDAWERNYGCNEGREDGVSRLKNLSQCGYHLIRPEG